MNKLDLKYIQLSKNTKIRLLISWIWNLSWELSWDHHCWLIL